MLKYLVPRTKMSWLLAIILVYAFIVYEDEYSPVQNDQEVQSGSSYNIKANTTTSKFLEAPSKMLLEKMSETKRGKAMIEAFISSSLEEEFGTTDLNEIAGKVADDVLMFDTSEGKGEVASCGSQVTVNYELFLENKIKFDSTYDIKTPKNFTVGDGHILPGIDRGVIGMRQGGKRRLIIPPVYAYGNNAFSSNFVPKDKAVSAVVELVKVENAKSSIKEYVKTADVVVGVGERINCGDKVKISYKLGYQQEGEIEVDKHKILHFTVGDQQVPIGLEQGMLGMQPGGVRSMVLSPELQQIPNPPVPALFEDATRLPREPMVTLEVKLLAVE